MSLHRSAAAAVQSPGSRGPRTLRIASVPQQHVYVWHLADPDGTDGVVRLPDPPVPARFDQSPWWPPAMLSADWIHAHRDAFDVFHIHFGFDALGPRELSAALDALSLAGKRLVYTAHDLRNPHHANQERHDAQLDILMSRADEVITLTPGAAAEIDRRWGWRATVLPHPHVVGLDELAAPRPRRTADDAFVVGVHAKSVRPSMDPVPVVETLTEAVGGLPGAQLRVDVHTEVLDPDGERYDAGLTEVLRRVGSQPHVDVRVHEFFTEPEFFDYLRDLSVSVLPYRFGTHSGWLEACHDLGTAVLAPTCGFYAEQRPCYSYRHDEHGLDAGSLAEAVTRAYGARPQWQAEVADRIAERRMLAAAHRALYERLAG